LQFLKELGGNIFDMPEAYPDSNPDMNPCYEFPQTLRPQS
jgi:hypothetical protein